MSYEDDNDNSYKLDSVERRDNEEPFERRYARERERENYDRDYQKYRNERRERDEREREACEKVNKWSELEETEQGRKELEIILKNEPVDSEAKKKYEEIKQWEEQEKKDREKEDKFAMGCLKGCLWFFFIIFGLFLLQK